MNSNARKILAPDSGPLIQFIKYVIAGGLSTGVSIIFFYTLGATLWPCLTEGDIVCRLLDLPTKILNDDIRGWNAVYCNIVSFTISNIIAYFLNVMFVFKRGRHTWWIEIGLFYLVSGIAAGVGTILMKILISNAGMMTSIAFCINIVTALLINYAVRRFFIFKG